MKQQQLRAIRLATAMASGLFFVVAVGVALSAPPGSQQPAPAYQSTPPCPSVLAYDADIDCSSPPTGSISLSEDGCFYFEINEPGGSSDSAEYSICGSVDITGTAVVSTTLNVSGWIADAAFVYFGYNASCHSSWWDPPCNDSVSDIAYLNPFESNVSLQVNGGVAAARVCFDGCGYSAPTPTPTITPTATPTPTVTPTPYLETPLPPSVTPYPTLWLGAPTATPTPYPVPTLFVVPMPAAACGDPTTIWEPILTQLDSTIYGIGQIYSSVDIESTLPLTVTISSNPFAIGMGLVALMGDITWLAILGAWFATAVLIIITLIAIRFIVSFWGIIKRIIDIIELIPGM